MYRSIGLESNSGEHLFLENYDFPGKSMSLRTFFFCLLKLTYFVTGRPRKESSALVEFLTNIPNLTSLTLIGFRLNDTTAQILAEVWLLLFSSISSFLLWYHLCFYSFTKRTNFLLQGARYMNLSRNLTISQQNVNGAISSQILLAKFIMAETFLMG